MTRYKILGNPIQAPPTHYPFQIPPMLKPDRRLCNRGQHVGLLVHVRRLSTAASSFDPLLRGVS